MNDALDVAAQSSSPWCFMMKHFQAIRRRFNFSWMNEVRWIDQLVSVGCTSKRCATELDATQSSGEGLLHTEKYLLDRLRELMRRLHGNIHRCRFTRHPALVLLSGKCCRFLGLGSGAERKRSRGGHELFKPVGPQFAIQRRTAHLQVSGYPCQIPLMQTDRLRQQLHLNPAVGRP